MSGKIRASYLMAVIIFVSLAITAVLSVFGFGVPLGSVVAEEETVVTHNHTTDHTGNKTWKQLAEGKGTDSSTRYYLGSHVSGTTVTLTKGNYYLYTGNGNTSTPEEAIKLSKIGAATIVITGNVTLCLNGYYITGTANDKNSPDGSVIEVSDGATFTLCDCQHDNAPGRIRQGNADKGGGVHVLGGGKFVMEGGVIRACTAVRGGGVHVEKDAEFTMSGGRIRKNSANNGTVGTTAANGNGGGVYVATGGKFTMTNGEIFQNIAQLSGGGVYIANNLTAGVASGLFTMSGGTISNNIAHNGGGGVSLNKGTFKMSGGIVGGTGKGQAIYDAATDKYKVDESVSTEDALLGGNTALIRGGGVLNAGGTVEISGDAKINNNSVLNVDEIGGGGGILVTTTVEKPITDGALTVTGGEIAGNQAWRGGGVFVGGNSSFAMSGGTVGGGQSGQKNTATGNGGGVYVHGGTFTMSGNANVIGNGAKTGGGVYINDGCTFTINNGTISYNTATAITGEDDDGNTTYDGGSGGGVQLGLGAQLTMYDGSISNNTARLGGGLYIYSKAVFTMKDGTVSYNNATDGSGGGMCVASLSQVPGEITIEKGTISHNISNIGGGLASLGAVNIGNGTVISDNTARIDGGGVLVQSATLTMTGGVISGNVASGRGGGVFVWDTNSAVNMSGGIISGNTATGSGGGVYAADDCKFTMTGGTIGGTSADDKNTASSGGGVYNTGAFDISGGAISGNVASSNGGGVYVGGSFNVSGGTVKSNKNSANSSVNSNVYLAGNKTISINKALKNGTEIGVTVPSGAANYVFTTGYGANNKNGNDVIAPTDYFFADNGACIWLTEANEIKVGHNPTVHESAKPASCTDDGNMEYWHCSVCSKYFGDELCTIVVNPKIAALGHSMSTVDAVAATCENKGIVAHLFCDNCKKHFSNSITPVELEAKDYETDALGHNYQVDRKEPTCEEDGYVKTTCSRCDYNTDETLTALGHTATKTNKKDPTCEENGNIEYWHCSVCNKNFTDEECKNSTNTTTIPAKGHCYNEPEWVWDSYYASAEATFSCSECSDIQKRTATAAANTIVVTLNQPASCSASGKKQYTATVEFDGKNYSDTAEQTLDRLAHAWTAHWSNWSKNSSGDWTVDVSFTCNATSAAHTEAPTNEISISHSTTTAADCIHNGVETYTASVEFNGTTYNAPDNNVTILATGVHAYSTEFTVDKAATCTVVGSKSKHCTTVGCTEKIEATVIPALEHSWIGTVDDSKMLKEYTAFETVNLDGLVIRCVCANDEEHVHTFTGGSAASVTYIDGNCLHYGDTSVIVDLSEYGGYTITGITVAKVQITVGGANWSSGGAELMSGYVKSEGSGYKYFAASTEGATQVTNAVVRYVDGTVTVTYPEGSAYTIVYANNTANASGVKTATATLTLKDTQNYIFVTASGATDATLNANGTVATVTKEWYAAVCDNGFTGDIDDWTFGTTASSLPALDKDDNNPATVALVLKRVGDEKAIGIFNRGQYADYINSTMPVGSYTLKATVGNVTVDDVEYEGFEFTFEFTVSAAALIVTNIAGLNNVSTTYDGSLHINQTFVPTAAVIARSGEWAKSEYDYLYGTVPAVTFGHADWSNYYTAAQIAAMADNTRFINAGSYVALYKISLLNYADVTGSFNVVIAKATYTIDVTFVGDSIEYDGNLHSLAIVGALPDGVTVEYYLDDDGEVIAFTGATNAGSYKIVARFTGDYENYEAISEMPAFLTIDTAKISLNLDFKDATYNYDGAPHSIVLSGALPPQVEVVYGNNGKIEQGTYNATATVSIKDEYKINYEFAQGTKTVYEATLTIAAANLDMDGVSFMDKTVTYTGNAYSLSISGNLPSGVTYSYENNNCVEVGTHKVIVHFYHNFVGYGPIGDKIAFLTIERASYNMNGVTFPDATVAYTGNAHSLLLRGTLPAGVSYYYVNNSRTKVGSQTVTVKFTGDSKNYKEINDMTATLTVIPASLGITNLSLEGMTLAYDGNTHSLAVNGNIPDGVSVKYYVTIDGKEIEFNGAMEAGSYDVTAKFVIPDSENYMAIRPLTARLTIVAPVIAEEPPAVVEPSVDEIDAAIGVDIDVDKQADAVLGKVVGKKDFPYWIVAVCIIAAEVLAMAVMGGYMAFRSYKKKKR